VRGHHQHQQDAQLKHLRKLERVVGVMLLNLNQVSVAPQTIVMGDGHRMDQHNIFAESPAAILLNTEIMSIQQLHGDMIHHDIGDHALSAICQVPTAQTTD